MRTFVQRPKESQRATPFKAVIPRLRQSGRIRDLRPASQVRGPIEQHGIQRVLPADHEQLELSSAIGISSATLSDLSRIPTHRPFPVRVQTKLTITASRDRHEQEADRVASDVVRAPYPPVRSGDSVAEPSVSSQDQGRPLSSVDQAFFGARFGYGLRGVRIHTDARAAAFTSAVQARAATLGNHIAFSAGQYNPSSSCQATPSLAR